MRKRQRTNLLYEEGALDRASSSAKRKYRKLRRMSQRHGIDLDALLIQRRNERRWTEVKRRVGTTALYCCWDSAIYVVEVQDAYKARIGRETTPEVRLRVCGIYDLQVAQPTRLVHKVDDIIEDGYRSILLADSPVAKSLEDVVQEKIGHAMKCANTPDTQWRDMWLKTAASWEVWLKKQTLTLTPTPA